MILDNRTHVELIEDADYSQGFRYRIHNNDTGDTIYLTQEGADKLVEYINNTK